MLTLLVACTPPEALDTSAPSDTSEVADTAQGADTAAVDPGPDCSGGSGWEEGHAFLEQNGGPAYAFVPEGGADCAPVVFWGHGGGNAGGANGEIWTDPLRTGLVKLADEHGFVLIVPGVSAKGDGSHEWSKDFTRLNRLEGFLEQAETGADIDRTRIWFIGQSAGGHMSAYLGLYVTDPWDSVAVISAGIGGYFDYPDPAPARKLPIFVAHDPDDQVVPYSYSEQLVSDLEANGHRYEFQDTWTMGDNGHGWAEGLSDAILDWMMAL